VFILDTVASFSPRDERESQSIIERVTPRLSHANAAVVLSAVKVGELPAFSLFLSVLSLFLILLAVAVVIVCSLSLC